VRASSLPLEPFLRDVAQSPVARVAGTAVFMAQNPEATPPALLHHIKHTEVLHERVVLLAVSSLDVPEVPSSERVEVQVLDAGFARVRVRCGFMQQPDVPAALAQCSEQGLRIDVGNAMYFVGRETLVIDERSTLVRLRKRLFAFASRNAPPATACFQLPPSRVVELGMQIEL
jgi:KUP system potassium uptake protein